MVSHNDVTIKTTSSFTNATVISLPTISMNFFAKSRGLSYSDQMTILLSWEKRPPCKRSLCICEPCAREIGWGVAESSDGYGVLIAFRLVWGMIRTKKTYIVDFEGMTYIPPLAYNMISPMTRLPPGSRRTLTPSSAIHSNKDSLAAFRISWVRSRGSFLLVWARIGSVSPSSDIWVRMVTMIGK